MKPFFCYEEGGRIGTDERIAGEWLPGEKFLSMVNRRPPYLDLKVIQTMFAQRECRKLTAKQLTQIRKLPIIKRTYYTYAIFSPIML